MNLLRLLILFFCINISLFSSTVSACTEGCVPCEQSTDCGSGGQVQEAAAGLCPSSSDCTCMELNQAPPPQSGPPLD